MMVRIYKDGRVKYTTLLNYDVNCPMNFVFYPFDKQALNIMTIESGKIEPNLILKVCTLGFESFDFTSDELWLSWMPEVSS